jgi:hypothetical protein
MSRFWTNIGRATIPYLESRSCGRGLVEGDITHLD